MRDGDVPSALGDAPQYYLSHPHAGRRASPERMGIGSFPAAPGRTIFDWRANAHLPRSLSEGLHRSATVPTLRPC